jgi:uncharacterized membrane protein
MIRLRPARHAEALLTFGRIMKYAGFVLAFIPIVVALPGLVLLIAGREMFEQGETLWNEIHRLPKRWKY